MNLYGKISRKYCKGKKARCRRVYCILLSITVFVNLFLIITPPEAFLRHFFPNYLPP